MGNKNGTNPHSDNKVTNTSVANSSISSSSSPHSQQLSEAFEMCLRKAVDGSEQSNKRLQIELFKNELFSSCTVLGENLFVYMTGNAKNETDVDVSSSTLSKEEYLVAGRHLLTISSAFELLTFYLKLFSHGANQISKKDFQQLIEIGYRLSWQCVGVSDANLNSQNPIFSAMILSLFSREEVKDLEDCCSWIQRNCPRLVSILHTCVKLSLYGDISWQKATAESGGHTLPQRLEPIFSRSELLTPESLWALVNLLPADCYITEPASDTLKRKLEPSLQNAIDEKVGWHQLYSSNEHGLSFNRFQHHVFEYKGATVSLLKFDKYCFCLALDEPWKTGTKQWGSSQSVLVQLLPECKVFITGSNLMYLNLDDRTAVKGLQVGKDSRTLVLSIDEAFSKVTHYGVSYQLQTVEVWGCAGRAKYEEQQKQRIWEHKEAEKAKQRKLKLEDWKDNPDRQLLDLGGVKVEHAEK